MKNSPIIPGAERGPRGSDLPAYVANGMVGIRVREIPLIAGNLIVNGIAGLHADERIEAAVPVPYALAGDIGVGEAWLSDQPWAVDELQQSYDFATAELSSSFRVHCGGKILRVEVTTFASRSHPMLILQHSRIKAEESCTVRLRTVLDTRPVPGHVQERLAADASPAGDGSILWVPEGGLSSCGIAVHSRCSGGEREQVGPGAGSSPLVASYRVELEADQSVDLHQIAALVPSLVHHRPREEAVRRLADGVKLGVDRLQALNRENWQDIWKGRIVIDGASRKHQQLIDAGFFYMNCSAHRSSPAATSMFGLASWADYHYYYGHVMWDIDAFCVPPLLLLQPESAQSLVDFRVRNVPKARRYAQLDGKSGMRFPWQAAPLSGEEAAPGDGPAASNAAHLSLHVARAMSLHADIVGDPRYLRESGWQVISGVADWLTQRLAKTGRGFELFSATGPAEVKEPPDNESFTLMAAHDLLSRAIRTGETIGADIPAAWRSALNSLYLPRRADGVIPSHDGFRIDEPKGATPSPLAGLFPMDYPATDRERKATLDFFLAHWRDYVGSPMLPAFYPAWAAMAGDRQLALDLFEEGYATYDAGRFHQCLEYRVDHPDSKVPAGPFLANIGAMLMTMLFGLPGLQVSGESPEAWAKRPVVLPAGWSSIQVERLWVREKPMRLVADHGSTRARLLDA